MRDCVGHSESVSVKRLFNLSFVSLCFLVQWPWLQCLGKYGNVETVEYIELLLYDQFIISRAGTAGLSGYKFSKRVERLKIIAFDRVQRCDLSTLLTANPISNSPQPSVASRCSNEHSEHSQPLLTREEGVTTSDQEEEWALEPPEKSAGESETSLSGAEDSRQRQPAPSLTVTICVSGWLRSHVGLGGACVGCSW